MDGSINFSGTLAGSIADSGGRIQDVQTNANGDYESVVDEQGIAKIDLSNYATNEELESVVNNINSELNNYTTNEELESAVNNINNVLLTKQNVVNYSTNEQVIGTYFGKPLYQKSYSFTPVNLSQGSWTPIPMINNELTNLSIDRCIACDASNDWCVLSAFTVQYDGSFMILNDRSGDITVDQIIIKYTKTTD